MIAPMATPAPTIPKVAIRRTRKRSGADRWRRGPSMLGVRPDAAGWADGVMGGGAAPVAPVEAGSLGATGESSPAPVSPSGLTSGSSEPGGSLALLMLG